MKMVLEFLLQLKCQILRCEPNGFQHQSTSKLPTGGHVNLEDASFFTGASRTLTVSAKGLRRCDFS